MTVNPNLQVMIDGLEMIWAPGAEAVKVQQALGVRELGQVSAVLKQAGYEICYVDLPEKVSGFAQVIEGKPYIVLNRSKSADHLQGTLPHELAHHILHLGTGPDAQAGLSSQGIVEFQAYQFAVMWIMLLAGDKEREAVLIQNPELMAVGAVSLFLSAGVVLVPIILNLLSLLSRPRLSAPVTGK